MPERLTVLVQHLLPRQALTQLAGRIASMPAGRLTTFLIERFIDHYGVDMFEAANPHPFEYRTFNEFFTRALKNGARVMANAPWLCPVDGAISQCGPIAHDQIFQAKGHQYSTTALLGGDAEQAAPFVDGQFATLYLSPRDYHRIHMPAAGRLLRMVHVPGDLYSVNPATARNIPGLFARNERVVCHFQGEHGPFVMVLVGATIVGSMATAWHGLVNPPRPAEVRTWTYDHETVELAQGAEMGRFLLGSTVVMLFPKAQIAFPTDWTPGRAVRLGERMG